jgi:dihydropteroate synthase
MNLHDPSTWPDRPLVMGIVNVTPDSFSDGGSFFRWEKAVEHGLRLVAEGADLLDIGGESTRPGAATISVEEELRRVLPVVRALAGEVEVPLSIDTRKVEVAAPALESGAVLLNDVGGLRDRKLLETAVRHGAAVCAMHMLGEPGTMQEDPRYDDVLGEVTGFLSQRARAARTAGVEAKKIWLDPGIGFGKTLEHNLALLRGLDRIGALGYPVLVGVSRKRFLGEISGAAVHERLPGSLAALEAVLDLPRAIVRVHDVAATRQVLAVRHALRHPARDA